MSFSSSRLRAKHFFDLHHPSAVSNVKVNFFQSQDVSNLVLRALQANIEQSIIEICFLCFRQGISVPGIQKWSGNSFTFHGWVCLDPVEIKERKNLSMDRKIFHYRRNLYRQANSQYTILLHRTPMLNKLIFAGDISKELKFSFFHLYSFFTTSGVGLEAFFSSTGHLVVAVCNRKEYTTVTVPICQLCDQTWVCSLSLLFISLYR